MLNSIVRYTLTFLLASNTAFAMPDIEKILCPSAEKIQQSYTKINSAHGGKYDDSYITNSSSSYYERETQIAWYISAWVPSAANVADAISTGRGIVGSVQFSKHQYAEVYTDRYGILRIACYYGPGEVTASGQKLS